MHGVRSSIRRAVPSLERVTRSPWLLAALASVALGACGAPTGSASDGEARLVLDRSPNAVHAGIYLADARGFTESEGVDLTIDAPGPATDPVALLHDDRATFAVMDLHDLALARESGEDLVAVMSLVQRPLATVLAAPAVRSPRALAGRRVGIPGRPWGAAVARAMVRAAGGKGTLRTLTVPDASRAVLAGRTDAAVGFWDVDGLALRRARPRTREFRIEDVGAPAYPELVLVTERSTLQDSPGLVQGTVTALRRGYREVILGPEEATGVMVDRVDDLDRGTIQAQLDAVLPTFDAQGQGFGELDPVALERWAVWEQRFGITRRKPDVTRMFDPRVARRGVISG